MQASIYQANHNTGFCKQQCYSNATNNSCHQQHDTSMAVTLWSTPKHFVGYYKQAFLFLYCQHAVKGSLVQGINASLPSGGKVLQHWGSFIGPIPRQGHPLRLGPLVLLGCLCPLDKAYQGPKLAQQLLLHIHAGARHQLILYMKQQTLMNDRGHYYYYHYYSYYFCFYFYYFYYYFY